MRRRHGARTEEAETAPARDRLLNRDFLLLWQGQAVSGVGTSLSQIATIYWLLQATGSATTMGLVSMAGAIPGVLLGPIGGAIADRFSRRRLIVIGDALLGLAMLLLGVAFFVIEDAVAFKVGCLVAAGVLSGVVNAFFRPAVMASIPNLVPIRRLNTANALNSFSMMTSMTIGQAIGGVLFRILGAPVMFLVNGVTYLLSSLSEAFIRMPQKLPEASPTMRSLVRAFGGDIVVGLRYVWQRAGLRNMVIAFAVLNFVTAPLAVLLPILLDVHRGLTSDWYGYLMAAMAAGNLVGMGLAGAMRIDGPSRFVFGIATLLGIGASTLVLGVATNPVFFLAANAISGMFNGVMMITFPTLMQATTPDALRGRVSSVMMTVMGGTMPLAMGLAGIAADAVDQNVPVLFIVAAFAVAGVAITMAFNRSFREFMSTRIGVSVGG